MKLRDIQQRLMASIFCEQNDNNLQSDIIEKPPALAPLSIYRDSILGGLIHAMKQTYPVCYQLVGEDFFNAMTRQYCLLTPSTQPDLNEYGSTFPVFIEGYRAAGSVPYLADMARLEWRCNLAMMASNEQLCNLHLLDGLSEQDSLSVVFCMPSSSYLLTSSFPVGEIWKMHQTDNGELAMPDGDETVDVYRYLIWRPQYELELVYLSAEQYEFVACLLDEMTLLEACEHCMSRYPGLDMNSLIEAGLQKKWIQSCYLKNND